jgi:hypothetical protein
VVKIYNVAFHSKIFSHNNEKNKWVKYSQTQLVTHKVCLIVLYPYYDLYNTTGISPLKDHSEDLCQDKTIPELYINIHD